jgi:polyisoprenyl-phosphate glycosyltransferase
VPPALTVVLPAHNEAGMLEDAVREVTAGLRERGSSFEIVVVENGSTDDTATIANRLAGEIRTGRPSSSAPNGPPVRTTPGPGNGAW